MDYALLRTVIETHPTHAATSDADMVTWLNEEVVNVDKSTVSSGALFAAILNNRSEWDALSATDREFVKDILYIHSGEGVPTAAGTPARTQLVAILGTLTKAEIASTIGEDVSRAVAGGVNGRIREGDVTYARTYGV